MGKKIIVVGGVAGGATAAARLRRLDEHATIIMFERGEYISFANCGLPYYIGDVIKDKEKLTLSSPEFFNGRYGVDVRTMSEVTSIDRTRKEVEVLNRETGKKYRESYDYLILAPGADPLRLPVEGADDPRVFTLRNIPDTYAIKEFIDKNAPKSAVVVGAGYIGIEMAENLHSLGIQVTIVEMASHVIAPLDEDMSGEVHKHIRSKGVSLRLNSGLTAIKRSGERLLVEMRSGEPVEADLVVMAAGIRPDTHLARDAGLAMGRRDTIRVDERMRTSDPAIYAVGDAVEVKDFVTGEDVYIPLASPANRQGRVAADNIVGLESLYKGSQGTAILKAFDMTVAVTGKNEAGLKAAGVDYEKSFTFSASNATYYPGATFMSIKLLFERPSGRILGAQITGYQGVDKRIDVIATAIRANQTVHFLTELELSYAPPFGSAKDPVNMAGYVAENILNGTTKVFHVDDVPALDRSKVTLLDVRTPVEYGNGTIEGAVNIPLDTLRNRANELDKDKPVYLFCQIGLRGYVAARQLEQKGFDVHNLSGGYRLYNVLSGREAPAPAPQTMKRISEERQMDLSEKGGKNAVEIDATGLQCPGPIMKVYAAMCKLIEGEELVVTATDPAFASDIDSWCAKTGNKLKYIHQEGGKVTVSLIKGRQDAACALTSEGGTGKNMIIFSGDLDKAIASFIIANGAAAMGRKVHMFFTFWGLNILRKSAHVKVKKSFIERMFGMMMPRGSTRLGLSRLNMAGMGAKMIRGVMKNKNINSLEDLIRSAMENGVEITACTMSMDVMGISKEELIDGISYGGVASMLGFAEESDMSLFI